MQEIVDGITKTYTDQERIVMYAVTHLGVTSLKNWSDDVVACLDRWPDERGPYLSLYDLSSQGVALPFLTLTGYDIYSLGITVAGQKRVNNILQSRPALKVKLALVLSPTLSGDIALRRGRQPDNTLAQIEHKVYLDKLGAIAWLTQFITPEQ